MSIETSNSVGPKSLIFANNFVRVVQEIMNATADLALIADNGNEEIERSYPSFLTGMMVMHGDRDLILTLTFSKEAAADIVVSLLGVKYNQIVETDVYDTVMETTNMIAGRLKTACLNMGANYQMTTPLVFVGKDHFLGAKARPAGITKRFKDKQFEMIASVFFL